jgi:hypothetical protein
MLITSGRFFWAYSYSIFRCFTGFSSAARIACTLTVSSVISKIATPTSKNTSAPKRIGYDSCCCTDVMMASSSRGSNH